MTYSQSVKEETEQLKKIANGSINGDEAIAILSSIFPTDSLNWTQTDVEDFLAGVYKLPPLSIDRVMLAFPRSPSYNFPDYDRNSPR